MELLSESWGRGLGRVLFRVAQSSVVLGLLALSCKGQRNKRWWVFPRLITDGVVLVMASSMSRLGVCSASISPGSTTREKGQRGPCLPGEIPVGKTSWEEASIVDCWHPSQFCNLPICSADDITWFRHHLTTNVVPRH